VATDQTEATRHPEAMDDPEATERPEVPTWSGLKQRSRRAMIRETAAEINLPGLR